MFHELVVSAIQKSTNNSAIVSFELPKELKNNFNYKAGQYLNLKLNLNGEEIRRSYSLCSIPGESVLKIGVKKVSQGKASTYLNEQLSIGDRLSVGEPEGNFVLPSKNEQGQYVFFAAGSGITPIYSIIGELLSESSSTIHLFYGNKKSDEVMLKSELDILSEKYGDRFSLKYSYSQEGGVKTRLNQSTIKVIIQQNLDLLKSNAFFMCGPEGLIVDAIDVLKEFGVKEEKLIYELFTTPVLLKKETVAVTPQNSFTGISKVVVLVDDEEEEMEVATDGSTILEVGIGEGIDIPYSCQGGVCCSCKGKVKEGSVRMDANYSLSDGEIEEGFILACQSHPSSERVVIDFDV